MLGQTSFMVYDVGKVEIGGRESVKEYKAESERGKVTKR